MRTGEKPDDAVNNVERQRNGQGKEHKHPNTVNVGGYISGESGGRGIYGRARYKFHIALLNGLINTRPFNLGRRLYARG